MPTPDRETELRGKLADAEIAHRYTLDDCRARGRELSKLEYEHGGGPYPPGPVRDAIYAARARCGEASRAVDVRAHAVDVARAELSALIAQQQHDRELVERSRDRHLPALQAAANLGPALAQGQAAGRELQHARADLADLADKIRIAEKLQATADELAATEADDLEMALRVGGAPKPPKPRHDYRPVIERMRADHAEHERRIRDVLEPAIKASERALARALHARTLLAALEHFDDLRKIALQHEGAIRALPGAERVMTPLVRIELMPEGFRMTFADAAMGAKRYEPQPGANPVAVDRINDEIREVFGDFARAQSAPAPEHAPEPEQEQAQAAE